MGKGEPGSRRRAPVMDTRGQGAHHMGMRLYWVDDGVAVAARPRGSDWLGDEMAQLRADGVDILVSCLTGPEEEDLGLTAESTIAGEQGIEFVRLPIEDRDVPADMTAFTSVLQRLDLSRHQGRRLAIHCRQGLGRSPLVAAALLVVAGASPDAAWTAVGAERGVPVPETEAQRAWLERFAGYRAAASYSGE